MTRRRRQSSSQGPLTIVGLIVALIVLAVASLLGINLLSTAGDGVAGGTPEPVIVAGRGDWYEVYFTDPACLPEEERQGGLDETVASDIRQAQMQVDIAAYDLDAEPIVESLIDLEQRGALVRVVTDDENGDLAAIRRLRRNGISVVEDNRSALMHNKFVVIDGRYVWTGSMNFTSNGAYCNNNNLVRFDSPELAANYAAEMDEMYLEQSFGPTSAADTPYPYLIVGSTTVENYFASEEKISPILANLINKATREVLFMAFSFTSDEIGEAIIGRADAGLSVRGVFETSGSETEFSYFTEMSELGLVNLQVRQDGNPRIMHHKVIVIDRQLVVLGSYNFSGSANDSNDENVVIVTDPVFAGYFIEEFETVWREAQS